MFKTLGKLTDQYRIQFIVLWLAIAVALVIFVPPVETNDDQTAFLPSDSPSIVSGNILQTHFPSNAQGGSVIFVFDAGEGNQITADENLAVVDNISMWLLSEDAPEGITQVQSPTLIPQLADRFISPNGQLAMMNVDLSNDAVANNPGELVEELRAYVEEVRPENLAVYLTGETAIFSDYETVINDTVGIISTITPIFVVIILLLIYRSPVSVFVSLFVIGVAYMVVSGIVGILVDNDVLTVSGTTMTLLLTIMLGSGTDYCLFLINRYREELANGADTHQATHTMVHRIGEIISGSAGTTTTGFLAMTTAQIGLFNTSGPVLAIGIVMSLLAGLTLTPAILSLLGKRAFWLTTIKPSKPTFFHKWSSRMVARRPLPVALVIIAVMLPFAIHGAGMETTYDSLSDMPEDVESVEGFRALEEQLGAGNLQPITAMTVLDSDNLLGETARLSAEIEALDGVASVLSATQPLGGDNPIAGITQVDTQLMMLAGMFTPPEDGSTPTEDQQAFFQSVLLAMPDYLEIVVAEAPTLADSDVYASVQADLDEIFATFALTDTFAGNMSALATEASGLEAVPHLLISDLPESIGQAFGGEELAFAINDYLNLESNASRFTIIVATNPFGDEALDATLAIREILETVEGDDAIVGTTANTLDLREILSDDFIQTIGIVMIGVFVVLLLILRSIIAPIYLVATITLSYATTLGITRIGSQLLWDNDQLTWWVPFFIFIFTVTLGIDYAIFLFGNIKEQLETYDTRGAVKNGIRSSGFIVVAGGLIVAATFSALALGEVSGLVQIGIGVGVGILMDTLVVRTTLDSALTALFGRWAWFPRNPHPNQPPKKVDDTQDLKQISGNAIGTTGQ